MHGRSALFFDVRHAAAPDGIVCLTGVFSGGHTVATDPGALNRELVLENNVVFGSVNANRLHYQLGAEALANADPARLARLITRRVPVARWSEAFARRSNDVKTVLLFGDHSLTLSNLAQPQASTRDRNGTENRCLLPGLLRAMRFT